MKKTRKVATIVSVVILLVVSLALTLTSCAPKVYKLTFDVDGAVVKTIDIPSVGTPELPDTPIKSGYTFEGWYFDKETLSDPCTAETIAKKQFTADTVAYAKWLKNDYSITYNLDGGTNVAANPSGYVVDTATIKLAAPTKLGYTFGGWYGENTFATQVTEITKGSIGNMTLFAKWTKNDYTITYNLDGGTNVAANPSGYAIDTPTITLAAPTKLGYTFGGWYGEDTFVNKVTEIAKGFTGNKTLFAKWTKNDYSITYNLDGGENAKNNPSGYGVNTATITLSDPSKVGYTFGGWYGEDTFANQVTEIAKGSTENKTLYAKWEITTYTITYAGLDGVGANKPTNANNTKTYNINTTTFTIQSPDWGAVATFVGWSTDGNAIHAVKSPTITKGSTGDITYTAHWTFTDYPINYNLDGGTNNSNNPSVYNIGSATITLKAPTKSGYTFGGWYGEDTFANQVTEIAKGSTENKTLYAKWEITTYTITYAGLDGVGANKPTNANNNTKTYNINTTTFTIQSPDWGAVATFVGWSTDGNVAHAVKSPTITIGSTGDITYTAHWTFTDYAINYELNGGVQPASYPKTYNIETGATLVAPTKKGYTFNGWCTDAGLVNSIATIAAGSTGAVNVYAKWTIATYNITYELKGGTNNSNNPKTFTIDKANITLQSPTHGDNWLTFDAWYDNAEFKGNAITEIAKGSFGDKTFYAHWNFVGTSGLSYETFDAGSTYVVSHGTVASGVVCIPSTYNNRPVTALAENGFKGQTGITKVVIEDGVTRLGTNVFEGCTSLASVTIPNSVTSIERLAFSGCSSLAQIKLPNMLTEIEHSVFAGSGITSIDIPNSVTLIYANAFQNCKALVSVTMSSNLMEIDTAAFSGCSALASVEMPSRLDKIYANAFENCTSLISVTMQNGVTRIGANAFNGCTSLASINIPSSVTKIESGAFNGCTSLKSIFIPTSVTYMGGSVFQGCTNLTISCERAESPLPSNWNAAWMGDVPTTKILWEQTRL